MECMEKIAERFKESKKNVCGECEDVPASIAGVLNQAYYTLNAHDYNIFNANLARSPLITNVFKDEKRKHLKNCMACGRMIMKEYNKTGKNNPCKNTQISSKSKQEFINTAFDTFSADFLGKENEHKLGKSFPSYIHKTQMVSEPKQPKPKKIREAKFKTSKSIYNAFMKKLDGGNFKFPSILGTEDYETLYNKYGGNSDFGDMRTEFAIKNQMKTVERMLKKENRENLKKKNFSTNELNDYKEYLNLKPQKQLTEKQIAKNLESTKRRAEKKAERESLRAARKAIAAENKQKREAKKQNPASSNKKLVKKLSQEILN